MSELVDIEDLTLLDGTDLRAVFGQVSEEQVLDALIGVPAGLRHQILTKLPAASAAALESRIDGRGPVSFESVQTAQRDLIEALCRLSRSGQVAFDDPADMVA